MEKLEFKHDDVTQLRCVTTLACMCVHEFSTEHTSSFLLLPDTGILFTSILLICGNLMAHTHTIMLITSKTVTVRQLQQHNGHIN